MVIDLYDFHKNDRLIMVFSVNAVVNQKNYNTINGLL